MITCSKGVDKKESTKHEAKVKIDKKFIYDVVTFRKNIKRTLDDMVINNKFDEVGSLSKDKYKRKIDFFFLINSRQISWKKELDLAVYCTTLAIG